MENNGLTRSSSIFLHRLNFFFLTLNCSLAETLPDSWRSLRTGRGIQMCAPFLHAFVEFTARNFDDSEILTDQTGSGDRRISDAVQQLKQ